MKKQGSSEYRKGWKKDGRSIETDHSFDSIMEKTPTLFPQYGEQVLKHRKNDSLSKARKHYMNKKNSSTITINRPSPAPSIERISPRRAFGSNISGWQEINSDH